MFKNKLRACFAFVLCSVPLVAFAIPFNFSYEYSNGTSLIGQLDGEVQSDNDTITVLDFFDVSWNGFSFAEISPNEIAAVSDFQIGVLDPIVSFSGNIFDLFVCPLGFGQSNNCSFSSEGGFLFGLMANFGQGPEPAVAIGDGQGNGLAEPLNPLMWSISQTTVVPEPSTTVLISLGILCCASFGQKRKLAHLPR